MNLFKNLPNKWSLVTVEEIAAKKKGSVVTGPFGSSIGKKYWTDLGVPVIRGNNIVFDGPKFIDDNFVFISNEYYESKMTRYTAVKDDIIFTAAGTIGQIGIIPSDTKFPFYIVSNKQMRLRLDTEAVDPRFAFYYFRTKQLREIILNNNTGSTIPLINLGVLKNLPFILPPLSIQRRIASILGALDDKIELNLEMNKTLEEMAMALYKHWFVDFGPFKDGNFVESELGMIPESWEVKRLKDFGNVVTGKTPSSKSPEHFGNKIPFVTPTDFKNYGMCIFNASRGISKIGIDAFNKKIVPSNSVIVTCIGSDMGKVAINKVQCLTNQQINSVVMNEYQHPYVYCYMVHNYEMLKNMAGDGTTMPIINKSDFENLIVLKPEKEILMKFNNDAMHLENLISNNIKENESLIQIRDALLPRLISGEVEVKVEEEELSNAI